MSPSSTEKGRGAKMRACIRDMLVNVRRLDAERGEDGFRSTRRVADYAGISITAARSHLRKLAVDGEVDAFDGTGRTEWRARRATGESSK